MFAFFSIRPRAIGASGLFNQIRHASSKRWQARQQKDQFTREAAVQGLKSRAAFKLFQVRSSMMFPIINLDNVHFVPWKERVANESRLMKNTGYSDVDKPLSIWYASSAESVRGKDHS